MASSARHGLHRHPLEVSDLSLRPDNGPFRVEIRRHGHTILVGPVGELDMATVDDLDSALRQEADGGGRDLVLDLRGVSFIDSTGLRVVIKWNALARERGITFAILQGGPSVHRVFEIVGLLDSLPFSPAPPADRTELRQGA